MNYQKKADSEVRRAPELLKPVGGDRWPKLQELSAFRWEEEREVAEIVLTGGIRLRRFKSVGTGKNGFPNYRSKEQKEEVMRHRLEPESLASDPVTYQLCLNCLICKIGLLIVLIQCSWCGSVVRR